MNDRTNRSEEERIKEALEQMQEEAGSSFSLAGVKLSELKRRTGVTRARLRRLKENGFEFKPHGRTG